MRALGALLLGLAGLAKGPFVNLLIDRVPLRRPLLPLGAWPRRCPSVELPPLPGYPDDTDDAPVDDAPPEDAPPDEADTVLAVDDPQPGPVPDVTPEPMASDDSDADPDADAPPPTTPALIPYQEVGDHGAPAMGIPLRRPRCPACGRRCSIRYPVVEALTAILFAGAALRFGADWVLPAYPVLFVCLIAVSAIDLDYHIIPNRIVYPTIFAAIPLLALAAVAGHDGDGLREALVGAAAAWTALLVIHLISPRGMGFGDVRLSFVLGLFLGWLTLGHVVTGLFMGFLLGALIGVGLILVGAKGRRDAIPFGPFLAAGTVLVIFVGDPIIDYWLG